MHRSAPAPSGCGRHQVVARRTFSACPVIRTRILAALGDGVGGALEDEEPRALAHDEPVAAGVERAGGQLRLVGAAAHDVELEEGADHRVADE